MLINLGLSHMCQSVTEVFSWSTWAASRVDGWLPETLWGWGGTEPKEGEKGLPELADIQHKTLYLHFRFLISVEAYCSLYFGLKKKDQATANDVKSLLVDTISKIDLRKHQNKEGKGKKQCLIRGNVFLPPLDLVVKSSYLSLNFFIPWKNRR